MALEDISGPGKYIGDLNKTWPVSADDRSFGDDHLRGIKNVLDNSFPAVTGVVTATHLELSRMKGQNEPVVDSLAALETRLAALERTVKTYTRVVYGNMQTDNYYHLFPQDSGHQMVYLILNGPRVKQLYHKIGGKSWQAVPLMTDDDGDLINIVPASQMLAYLNNGDEKLQYQFKLGADGDPDQWVGDWITLYLRKGQFTFQSPT